MHDTTPDISQVAAHTNVGVYGEGPCVNKLHKVNNQVLMYVTQQYPVRAFGKPSCNDTGDNHSKYGIEVSIISKPTTCINITV